MGNKPYRIPGPNKSLYEGECNEEGQPHGQGKIKYSDKCFFEGTFENGVPSKGKFTY